MAIKGINTLIDRLRVSETSFYFHEVTQTFCRDREGGFDGIGNLENLLTNHDGTSFVEFDLTTRITQSAVEDAIAMTPVS